MSILSQHAEEILEDEAFKEAVALYSKTLTMEWASSEKPARREELWMQQKALTAVVNNLMGFIDNAKYEMRTNAKEGWLK